jgi:hypothetical protein
MGASRLPERMPVIGACGTFVGKADAVEGAAIKLAANSPGSHGRPHCLPQEWVDRLDAHGHPDRPGWVAAPTGAGA